MDKNPLNVNLDVEDESCLVVGGGRVAERKVKLLNEAGADITVVSPEISETLSRLLEDEGIRYLEEKFGKHHLESCFLAIAATSDEEVNKRISESAREKNIPVNVADDGALSNFTLTANFNCGNLMIAVSTAGASPALSASIKKRLEDEFDSAYSIYLDILERMRPKIIKRYPEDERRRILLELGNREVENALDEGDLERAFYLARETLPEEPEKTFIDILNEVGIDIDGEFDYRNKGE